MATAQNPNSDYYISVEDYLQGELESEIKHEYSDGHVYAMTGGTDNHQRICADLSRELGNHFKGKGTKCEIFPSGMKVNIQNRNFRYPDIMVVCDETSQSNLYKECPVIIVEVLSSSTRKKDTTEKMLEYLSIPTLKEYVLIEQDFVDVEVLSRASGWKPEHYYLGSEVRFDSIGFTISVEEIYERVINEDMVKFLQAKAEEKEKESGIQYGS